MRIYQVPVCVYCREQADWDSIKGWNCLSGKHKDMFLQEHEIKWVEVIPLREEDDDFSDDWRKP